jgi:hypothetical protein
LVGYVRALNANKEADLRSAAAPLPRFRWLSRLSSPACSRSPEG